MANIWYDSCGKSLPGTEEKKEAKSRPGKELKGCKDNPTGRLDRTASRKSTTAERSTLTAIKGLLLSAITTATACTLFTAFLTTKPINDKAVML